jgi:hypothetical protein
VVVELELVIVVVVVVELGSWHKAWHGGEPWHPFTCIAQKELVQSSHERSIAGVWHWIPSQGKQQAQVLPFIMDTPIDENRKRITVNMFLRW